MSPHDPGLAGIRSNPNYDDAFSGEPLISVCIPTLNRAKLLCERSLPSVIAQTYTHWEAIVVGDGGTDDTAERIAALGDPRVQFFNLTLNGPYPDDDNARWQVAGTNASNEAAARANGRWIAVNNDDDDWSPDHLAVLFAEAQRTRAEVVYGRMRIAIHGTGEESAFGMWPPQLGDFAFQSAIVHADLRGFRADVNAYKLGEPGDWNLARRMIEAGVRFAFLPDIVGTYHLYAGHMREGAWSDRVRREARSRRTATEDRLPSARPRSDEGDELPLEDASLASLSAETELTLAPLRDDDAIQRQAHQFALREVHTARQLRAYRDFVAGSEARRMTHEATRDALLARIDDADAGLQRLSETLRSRDVSVTLAAERMAEFEATVIARAERMRTLTFAADTDVATRELATIREAAKAALDTERTGLRRQLAEREATLAGLLSAPPQDHEPR